MSSSPLRQAFRLLFLMSYMPNRNIRNMSYNDDSAREIINRASISREAVFKSLATLAITTLLDNMDRS